MQQWFTPQQPQPHSVPQPQQAPQPEAALSTTQSEGSLRRIAQLLLESMSQPAPALPAPAAQVTVLGLSSLLTPPPLTGPHITTDPLTSLGLPAPALHVVPQFSRSLPDLNDSCGPLQAKRVATEPYIPALSNVSGETFKFGGC
jgi:hypothetical protein